MSTGQTVDHGEVWLGDTDLGVLDERQLTRLRRDQVGFIFQSFNLLPTLTAWQNSTLSLAIAGHRPDRAWLDRVVDALGLRDRLGRKPAELSGGQQQRLAAARALAGRPRVVVLADGRVVDRIVGPTAERVLDRMKALGG